MAIFHISRVCGRVHHVSLKACLLLASYSSTHANISPKVLLCLQISIMSKYVRYLHGKKIELYLSVDQITCLGIAVMGYHCHGAWNSF